MVLWPVTLTTSISLQKPKQALVWLPVTWDCGYHRKGEPGQSQACSFHQNGGIWRCGQTVNPLSTRSPIQAPALIPSSLQLSEVPWDRATNILNTPLASHSVWPSDVGTAVPWGFPMEHTACSPWGGSWLRTVSCPPYTDSSSYQREQIPRVSRRGKPFLLHS